MFMMKRRKIQASLIYRLHLSPFQSSSRMQREYGKQQELSEMLREEKATSAEDQLRLFENALVVSRLPFSDLMFFTLLFISLFLMTVNVFINFAAANGKGEKRKEFEMKGMERKEMDGGRCVVCSPKPLMLSERNLIRDLPHSFPN